MKEEDEIWKTLIQGGDLYSRYKVSSEGIVWDCKNNKELSQVITGIPQYKYVNLCNHEGKWVLRRVHNIMGWTFLGTPPTKSHSVDHIDQDKFNNQLSNLRWLDRKGQINNRANTIHYDGVPLTDFLSSKGMNPREGIGNYVYNKIATHKKSFTEAIFLWAEFVCPYPKKIPEGKEVYGYEHEGVWYPTLKDYVEIYANCTYDTYRERIKRGMTHEQALVYEYENDLGRYSLNGMVVGLEKYCEYYNVSSIRIASNMSKHNLTIDEAIQVPVRRIITHAINGVVKRNSDWAKHFSLDSTRFKTQVCKKDFRKALQYFGIDTSDMEIYPCDGDVIMYHDKRYIE